MDIFGISFNLFSNILCFISITMKTCFKQENYIPSFVYLPGNEGFIEDLNTCVNKVVIEMDVINSELFLKITARKYVFCEYFIRSLLQNNEDYSRKKTVSTKNFKYFNRSYMKEYL